MPASQTPDVLDSTPITVRMIVEHALVLARMVNSDDGAFADRDAGVLAGYILCQLQDAYYEALHYVGVPADRIDGLVLLTMEDRRVSLAEVLADLGIDLDGPRRRPETHLPPPHP